MQRYYGILLVLIGLLLSQLGCNFLAGAESIIEPESELAQQSTDQDETDAQAIPVADASTSEELLADPPATDLISPQDLQYMGAFRLPEGSNESTWEYSGYAMTFYPAGDPTGPADTTPGSLFILGHDQQQMVSELAIPQPIISDSKNLEELNTAETLQPFADITNGMFGYLEIPRAGLAYLPDPDGLSAGLLHFAWGQHLQYFEASHGWSGIDLSDPQPAGPWHFGDYTNYISNDYLFEIPPEWAASIGADYRLASGRFRDGQWSGLGPALLAYAPFPATAPAAAGTTITTIKPLLLYGSTLAEIPEIQLDENVRMESFSEPDEWSGAAWLTTADQAAVIFVGTKAIGRSWYGFGNGVEFPISEDPNTVYPEVPDWPHDSRGYWSEEIAGQILFYNPHDLVAVANGTMQSGEPQPYAVLDLNPYLYDPGFDYEADKNYVLGAVAFDRENGILYIVERRADEEKSIIHVFEIQS